MTAVGAKARRRGRCLRRRRLRVAERLHQNAEHESGQGRANSLDQHEETLPQSRIRKRIGATRSRVTRDRGSRMTGRGSRGSRIRGSGSRGFKVARDECRADAIHDGASAHLVNPRNPRPVNRDPRPGMRIRSSRPRIAVLQSARRLRQHILVRSPQLVAERGRDTGATFADFGVSPQGPLEFAATEGARHGVADPSCPHPRGRRHRRLSGPLTARQQPPVGPRALRPDFDIRERRPPAEGSARARAELRRADAPARRGSRLDPYTGALRVLDAPGWSGARTAPPAALRNQLVRDVERLGLEDEDLDALTVVRDYVSRSRECVMSRSRSRSTAFRCLTAPSPSTSRRRAKSCGSRRAPRAESVDDGSRPITAEAAASIAAGDVDPNAPFVPVRVGEPRDARRLDSSAAAFLRDVTASLVWFAMDGGLRLAWHVELEPDGLAQDYDVPRRRRDGELLLRRNRVLDAEGTGRVLQSAATAASIRAGPTRCLRAPPPASAGEPRAPGPRRALQGRLDRARRTRADCRATTSASSAATRRPKARLGTFDGSRAGCSTSRSIPPASAETALFFALNFAHDFFYDLGFDEAAGNFQVNNFGRGGLGGDPIAGVARAAGRNNATFQPAQEGSSPIISMFLWDGLGLLVRGRRRRRHPGHRRRLRHRHRPARVPSRREPPPQPGVQRQRGRRHRRGRQRFLRLLDQRRYGARRVRPPGRTAHNQRQDL